MIDMFPFLGELERQELADWLTREHHRFLSEFHKYASCGNDAEAVRAKAYAGCFQYILMMLEFNMVESGE